MFQGARLAPVLAALPAFSAGTSKTVSWATVATATSYTIQIATDPGFTQNVAAQTVTTPYATFANLTHGVTYYYRVTGKDKLGTNGFGTTSGVRSIDDARTREVIIGANSPTGPQSMLPFARK